MYIWFSRKHSIFSFLSLSKIQTDFLPYAPCAKSLELFFLFVEKGTTNWISKCRNAKRERKKIAQQLQAIANRASGTLPAEIETTGYKVTSFDSQYVTFLHSHELDSEEWPHYMQLHHQLHTYCWRNRRGRAGEEKGHFSTMLALILLEIEYSYEREREKEIGSSRNVHHDWR